MPGTKAGAEKRKQLYGKDFQSRVAKAGGGNPILSAARMAKETQIPTKTTADGVTYIISVESAQ